MDSAHKALAVALIVLGIAVPLSFVPTASAHQMSHFSSYSDLVSFVQSKPSLCDASDGGLIALPGTTRGPVPSNLGSVTASSNPGLDYSGTNVQVQGVDELDTVKTDGHYIYTITNNTLVIVKAYPATAPSVVSTITPNGTITGVFVSGDKLILIGGTPNYWPISTMGVSRAVMPYWYSAQTRLWVYDISDRSSPALLFSLQERGGYVGSRLIASSVYLITTENIIMSNSTLELPSRTVNSQVQATSPMQIYHSDVRDYSYSFTTVTRVDFAGSIGLSSQTFLISASSTIYVSTANIYLTSTIWNCQQETAIHRVGISKGEVSYEATGTVLGGVMNQFSMDEYNGYLRVATTSWPFVRPLMMGVSTTSSSLAPAPTPAPGTPVPITRPAPTSQGPTTNIYVLDMSLQEVGRLERLAPGEQFHSARFMGDRGYLVTFKKTDPLFVIDLRNPHAPKVLGELYAPGYSDYLQPYDETHLIGIGKNATDSASGTFAWYQGVKVSLFDVSDPTKPVEVSNYVIGDRGTQSPALSDSHAVLFDHDRNLLVVPVEVAQLQVGTTIPSAWGTLVWQGAYVFNLSPEGGIVFKGGVTHLQKGETPSYSNYGRFVERSLFINEVLYTVSSAMIKMNNLGDLSEIGSVRL